MSEFMFKTFCVNFFNCIIEKKKLNSSDMSETLTFENVFVTFSIVYFFIIEDTVNRTVLIRN